MAKLPPLRVPRKPLGIASKTGMVPLGQLPDGIPGKHDLENIGKQTAQLSKVT